MGYVKVCPNPSCRHPNDQYAAACTKCDELLGATPPIPMEEAQSAAVPEPPPVVAQPADHQVQPVPAEQPRQPGPIQETKGIRHDLLMLQFIRGGRVFPVRDGQFLGRDDGSDDPTRVNVPADAGVDVGYVSRWHCQFQLRDGQWTVTPLDPGRFPGALARANPTFLGAQPLAVGQAHPVNDGDRLTLADVELRIKLT